MERQEMVELAEIVSKAVVAALKENNLVGGADNPVQKRSEKTAYQKTEQLLYNYRGFQKIVADRMQEIEDLRKYGVPQKSAMSGGERVQSSRSNVGIVLPEESVEQAVRTVQESVQGTIQAIALIDKCMNSLRSDPYYKILELRYFEGRTQEDIAWHYNVSQVTISNNKNRLVRELSMRLFPNQVVDEMMH